MLRSDNKIGTKMDLNPFFLQEQNRYNSFEIQALFPFPPHLTQTRILWSNEWFYKVNYEDQICLLWPNYSACQFSRQPEVNSNFK